MRRKQTVTTWLLCLLAAFLLVGICSKCSPLYPFNEWGDANEYFTVGKGMMNGRLPYRDLYDQKGPFLFLIQGIGWLLSPRTFHGVYVLQVLSMSLFLYYGYQTMKSYNQKASKAWIPVLGLMTVASAAYAFGNSAEEFALPMLSYGLYTALRYAAVSREERTPIPFKAVVLNGFLAGCVFWTKFSMCGFYLGWALSLVWMYATRKEYKALCQSAGAILLGLAAATLPWLLYFGIQEYGLESL